MTKKEFYFDSRDGRSRLYAVRWMPEPAEKVVCVVQIVHGMAEHSARYEEFAKFLTDRGIVVTAEDHLGHGRSVGGGGTFGYFCEQDPATVLVRDVHRLKKMTQELYPEVPYVILGHSMGSFIARNYMFRYGTGITAAIIMGTGMQSMAKVRAGKAAVAVQRIFCGPKHVSRLLDKLILGGGGRTAEQTEPGNWLSRDEERVAEYDADPMCGFAFTVNGFGTLFELVERLYSRRNLEKIPKSLPVLMLSGTADPVGEYGQGVRRAYESLKGCGMESLELKLYDGGRHELLNDIIRGEVMDDIYGWLEKTVLRRAESQG